MKCWGHQVARVTVWEEWRVKGNSFNQWAPVLTKPQEQDSWGFWDSWVLLRHLWPRSHYAAENWNLKFRNATITGDFGVVVDYHDFIVCKRSVFKHFPAKPAFSNSSALNNVFKKFRFRDAFPNFSGICKVGALALGSLLQNQRSVPPGFILRFGILRVFF